jgi:hypothetical protein
MIVATFNASTGWAGKAITYEGSQFVLEGHGVISAADVMRYGQEGQLSWDSDGTRAWVGSMAARPGPAPRAPASASPPTARPATDGRTPGQKAASIAGLFLLVIGLIMFFYFAAAFDTSVAVDYSATGGNSLGFPDRVNNIGLMQERDVGIVAGLVLAVGGGVLMVIGRKRATAAAPHSTGAVGTSLATAATGQAGVVGELERLIALRASGAITEQEFASLKARLLGG